LHLAQVQVFAQIGLGEQMTELLYKELTFAVIGAAMEVHRILGPGFLEAVYQVPLERELTLRGIPFEKQVKLPVTYKDILVGEYIADFIIDGKLIVEIKAVSNFNSQHQAQAIHYLAATGLRLALLLNFGTGSLEHRRVIK
jgi:GxxExxY protein